MVLDRKLCTFQTKVTVESSNPHLALPSIFISTIQFFSTATRKSLDSLKQSLNRQSSRPMYRHTLYQSQFKKHASRTNQTAGSNPAVGAFP